LFVLSSLDFGLPDFLDFGLPDFLNFGLPFLYHLGVASPAMAYAAEYLSPAHAGTALDFLEVVASHGWRPCL